MTTMAIRKDLFCLLMLVLGSGFGSVNAGQLNNLNSISTCEGCDPSGQTASVPPDVGPGLDGMYVNLVQSVEGIRWKKRKLSLESRDTAPICCT
jgi:hypothetical protein